jgi:uncharacterized protein YukE
MNQREYEDSVEKFENALEGFKEYLREELKGLKDSAKDFEGYDFRDDFYEILSEII